MKKLTGSGCRLAVIGYRFAAALAVGMLAGNAFAETYLATGGDISNNYPVGSTTYAVHVFTNHTGGPYYFTPTVDDLTVDYLIVGGGGGGGRSGNEPPGGGGGGGVIQGAGHGPLTKNQGYPISVGGGGAGGLAGLVQPGGDSSARLLQNPSRRPPTAVATRGSVSENGA